jgi:16S rRNA (uracil1498-N3)-methyltransferase
MNQRTIPPNPPTFSLRPEQWGEPFVLQGPEHHHLRRVLRVRPGEIVRLIDGCGRIGLFEVLLVEKERSLLGHIESRIEPTPETRLVLALGWNRAIRRSWVLEKAVEFGCHGLILWQAARSQGQVPREAKESWTSLLLAGAKQSANPWVPSVETLPGGVDDLVRRSPDFDHRIIVWEGELERRFDPELLGRPGTHLLVLGPEGGFDPLETDRLTGAGFLPVGLGKRILRWETAALLCLGLYWWSGQGGPATP